jgi:hypothetical protein
MFFISDYITLSEKGWGKPLPDKDIDRLSKFKKSKNILRKKIKDYEKG